MLDPLDDRDADAISPAPVGARGPVHAGNSRLGPVRSLLNTAGSVVKIGLWTNPRTPLAGRPGVSKTAVWGDPVPLAVLHDLAVRTSTTVNDVCTTLVSGAVARYLADTPGPATRPG